MEAIKGWPADKVERRSVAQLLPHAKNSRTHTAKQVDQIAASIEKWGFTNPVLIDEAGTIIAGHGRVLAAKKLKLAEVPVMVAAGWSDEDKRAYLIADNQLALNAGWDVAVLKSELSDLKGLDFDLAPIGFDPPQLAEIFDPPAPKQRGGRQTGAVNFSVTYNLVFDSEAQQAQWFAFVRWLKANYASHETLGAMLSAFIEEKGHKS
ncbi:MAG: hypothetical protein GC190_20435 [Alphaproteobacteria bacterium]|nr:hypothetical protein [Alphaproteobacteria bacterium]